VNNKLQKLQTEAVVTYFQAISRKLPAGFGENHEISVRICSSGRDLKPEPPEYEAGLLLTPTQSVKVCVLHSTYIINVRGSSS
jgi:hypothetical protein